MEIFINMYSFPGVSEVKDSGVLSFTAWLGTNFCYSYIQGKDTSLVIILNFSRRAEKMVHTSLFFILN